MPFPKEFLWGVATSAYQIEGAVGEGGRGESIWDRFSHTPGRVHGDETGDVACDHYHRFEADVDLMAQLGVQSYRFSVAWPRIFPTGSGRPNPAGLDFYKRLVEKLLERSIHPAVTLYHWDLPQTLQEQGGWANRETALRFQEYAATVARELGDRVTLWTTHNEPFCTAFLGHATGEHAPGAQDWALAVKVSHHVLLSHGLAAEALRQEAPGAQVGITLNFSTPYAAGESEADREAFRRFDGWHHRWFLEPVLRGRYPEDMLTLYATLAPLDYIRPEDPAVIGKGIDYLGVNYYTAARVVADPRDPLLQARRLPPQGPVTAMGWEVVPDGLYDLLVRLHRESDGLPLYIHENGAAYPDQPGADGAVNDPERVAYLQAHFQAAERALAAGVNLKGYYVWSFLDNFEWAHGYSKRFGLVYVDYTTQRRIPKASAYWYRDVIARGGLV